MCDLMPVDITWIIMSKVLGSSSVSYAHCENIKRALRLRFCYNNGSEQKVGNKLIFYNLNNNIVL